MRKSYLAAAMMVSAMLFTGTLHAQSDPGRLPGSALGSQGQVSEKDQQQIVAYIEYWVKQLQSSDPEAVATARGRLIEAYSQGGTETFINYYDQNLANRIAAGMSAKEVAGRLNTQIVARFIRHEKVADVIKAGLRDASSAVAYQAAYAAEALTKNAKVGDQVKLGLRLPLMESLKKESSSYVLSFLYSALVAIDDPAGWDAVLTKMNERLAVHVAEEDAGIDAEAEGLKAFYNRLVLVKSAGSNAAIKVNDKTLHLATLVSVRYLNYALTMASATEATSQLIDTCDYISNTAAKWLVERGANINVPALVKTKGTKLEKQLMLNDWRDKVLTVEPFKFAIADVALPKKP